MVLQIIDDIGAMELSGIEGESYLLDDTDIAINISIDHVHDTEVPNSREGVGPSGDDGEYAGSDVDANANEVNAVDDCVDINTPEPPVTTHETFIPPSTSTPAKKKLLYCGEFDYVSYSHENMSRHIFSVHQHRKFQCETNGWGKCFASKFD